MKSWICPKCKTEYPVAPKHCPCEPLNMEVAEGVSWCLFGNGSITLNETQYDAIIKELQGKGVLDDKFKRTDGFEDNTYRVIRQEYYIGIETANVSDTEIPLTTAEYLKIIKLVATV